ncbi:MAG: phosphatidate phosphatase App1 family protein [Nannocystales bacterium]
MRPHRAGLVLATWGLCACPQDPTPTHAAASETPPARSSTPPRPSKLASDEVVRFLPTFGTKTPEGWSVPIEAWVFEPEDDGPVRAATAKLVEEAMETQVDEATSKRIAQNLRPFMVDNERGKRLTIQAGSTAAAVCTSGSDGRCSGTLVLPAGSPPSLEVSVVLRPGDPRRFSGRVFLLPDEGVSVLSDIDDTIKITEVHDKKRLVENTFAKPARACPGVAALYRRWASQGAAFHYVSNSPLPLLGAIESLIADADYPAGSLQLKPFRWRDGSFLDLLAAPENHKQEAITDLIERFEHRRFILVGDTGERDPEIYAALLRGPKNRVAKVYLRDTGSMRKAALQTRLESVFEGLPRASWAVFEDASEIEDDLPGS